MNTCNIQTEVWNSLSELLRDEAFSRCHSQSLQILKILRYTYLFYNYESSVFIIWLNISRDQQYLDTIITDSLISLLIDKANLNLDQSNPLPVDFEGNQTLILYPVKIYLQIFPMYAGISEAQKCIFNLIFSHVKSRELVANSSIAKAIFLRLSSQNSSCFPHDVILFDLKILFLISALCIDCRYVKLMFRFNIFY